MRNIMSEWREHIVTPLLMVLAAFSITGCFKVETVQHDVDTRPSKRIEVQIDSEVSVEVSGKVDDDGRIALFAEQFQNCRDISVTGDTINATSNERRCNLAPAAVNIVVGYGSIVIGQVTTGSDGKATALLAWDVMPSLPNSCALRVAGNHVGFVALPESLIDRVWKQAQEKEREESISATNEAFEARDLWQAKKHVEKCLSLDAASQVCTELSSQINEALLIKLHDEISAAVKEGNHEKALEILEECLTSFPSDRACVKQLEKSAKKVSAALLKEAKTLNKSEPNNAKVVAERCVAVAGFNVDSSKNKEECASPKSSAQYLRQI